MNRAAAKERKKEEKDNFKTALNIYKLKFVYKDKVSGRWVSYQSLIFDFICFKRFCIYLPISYKMLTLKL